MNWIEIWKWVLLLAMVSFALLAVVITIRGALDLGEMFRRLKK